MSTYGEIMPNVRELWHADDFDTVNDEIVGRQSGLVLANNGAKHLPYKPWGVNLDGSVPVSGTATVRGPVPVATNQVLDIRCQVRIKDVGGTGYIFASGTSPSSPTYRVRILSGAPSMEVRTNVTAWPQTSAQTLSQLSYSNGSLVWFRVVADFSVHQLFVSPDGSNWTLAAEVTGISGTNWYGANGRFEVGYHTAGGTDAANFDLLTAEVRYDGTIVADFDVSKITPNSGPILNDGYGNSWYGIGSAAWGDHLRLPGRSGEIASAPDATAVDITGDIDIRALIGTYPTANPAEGIVSKRKLGGNQRAYEFERSGTNGTLYFRWSSDGVSDVQAVSTTTLLSAGAPAVAWVRVTRSASTGDVKFWWSSDGRSWDQLGATVSGAAGSIFASTSDVVIGASQAGNASRFNGKIYRAQIFASLDGTDKRADVRFDQPLRWSGGSMTDDLGNVWTIYRSALQSRLTVVANSHVDLYGTEGDHAGTPDSPELDVLNDIDVRVKCRASVWASGTARTLLGKAHSTSQRAYFFGVYTDGKLFFTPSLTSTGGNQARSTHQVQSVVANDVDVWLRATRVSDTGVVTFFTSLDGAAWTQLGDPIAGVAGPMYDSPADLEIGSFGDGASSSSAFGSPWNGRIYEAQVWKGIPGVSSSARLVANPKFTALTNYAPYKEPSYLALPGVSGAYASTPDHNDLDVTGDLELIAATSFDTYRPTNGQGYMFMAKGNITDSNASFRFYLTTTGFLVFGAGADGVAQVTATSSAQLPSSRESALWVKVTWRQSDGRVQFFTSDDGSSWAQNGTDQTVAVASIYSGNGLFEMGSRNGGTVVVAKGRYHRAIVKDGIDGTTVFDADFSNLTDGQTSFTEATGKTVTVNGTARIERRTWTFNRAALSPRAEHRTGRYSYLPGVAQNYLYVLNDPSFKIADDLDLRAEVSPDSWSTGTQMLVTRMTGTDGYGFALRSDGTLGVWIGSTSGGALSVSTVATGFTAGTRRWVRVTWRSSDGRIQFLTSLDGVTWSQLGADVTGLVGPLVYDTNQRLEIGTYLTGNSSPIKGIVYKAEVRDGSTIVAAFDMADAMLMPSEPHNGFTDLYGNAWTVNRATSGRRTSLVDRSLALLDGSSWLESAYDPLFDVTDGDATVALLMRAHSNATWEGIASQAVWTTSGADGPGWVIGNRSPTTTEWQPRLGDGVSSVADRGPNASLLSGSFGLFGFQIDNGQLTQINDGVLGGSPEDVTGLGDTSSGSRLRIGEGHSNRPRGEFEFVGFVLLESAVAPADLPQLFDPYYNIPLDDTGDIATAEKLGHFGELFDDFDGGPSSVVGTLASNGEAWSASLTGDATETVDASSRLVLDGNVGRAQAFIESGTETPEIETLITQYGLGGWNAGILLRWLDDDNMVLVNFNHAGDADLLVHVGGVQVQNTSITGSTGPSGGEVMRVTLDEDGLVTLFKDGVQIGTPRSVSPTYWDTVKTWSKVGVHGWDASPTLVSWFRSTPLDSQPLITELSMAGAGNVASQELVAYPDLLTHGQFFADTFDGPDRLLSEEGQWTDESAVPAEIVNGKMRMQSPAGPVNYLRAEVIPLIQSDYLNTDLLMKASWPVGDGTSGAVGFIAGLRLDEAALDSMGPSQIGSGNGAYFYYRYSTNQLRLSEIADGVKTDIASPNNMNLADGAARWIRLRCVGNQLMLRIWGDADPEPAEWLAVATLSQSSAGKVGLSSAKYSSDSDEIFVDIDEFYLADIATVTDPGGIPTGELLDPNPLTVEMVVASLEAQFDGSDPTIAALIANLSAVGDVGTQEQVDGLLGLLLQVGAIGDITSAEDVVWDLDQVHLYFSQPYRMGTSIERLFGSTTSIERLFDSTTE